MKITSKTYDILLNMINTSLESQENETVNQTTSNQDAIDKNPTIDNPSTLPTDIEKLLENLDNTQKNNLFSLLSKINLPLSKEELLQLQTNSFDDTNIRQNTHLTALNLLISNRIPLLPVLVSSLAETLDSESSLSNKINQLLGNLPTNKLNSEPKANNNIESKDNDILKTGKNIVNQQTSFSSKIKQLLDNLITISVSKENTESNNNTYLKTEETPFADKINQLLENIIEKDNYKLNSTIKDSQESQLPNTAVSKQNNINTEKNINPSRERNISQEINKLLLKINLSPDKLTEELEKYPKTIKQSLQSLVNQTGIENLKIFNHLLGQQIINQQENTLLNIEIPLLFPDSKKAVPFHLEIKEGERKEQKNQPRKKKNYKIRFIISLEKRGTIMSDIKYQGKKLSSSFYCDSKETCQLIKEYIPELKHKLGKSGIELINFDINHLDEKEKHNQSSTFNKSKLDLTEESGEYIHIDFKI